MQKRKINIYYLEIFSTIENLLRNLLLSKVPLLHLCNLPLIKKGVQNTLKTATEWTVKFGTQIFRRPFANDSIGLYEKDIICSE